VKAVEGGRVIGADGSGADVDTIILGTGFHVTDMPFTEKVHGRDGRSLAQVWNGSPQAHLGTMVAGYPNFFTLLGPNTGLGHTSIVLMTESQLRLVTNALRELKRSDKATIEPLPEAQARYNDWVQARLSPTVWNQGGCASWYIDENGRNSTLWPDTTIAFQRITAKLRLTEYAFGNRRAEKTQDNLTKLHAA
jgi:cation diffusion facilitator CzcD-associated flavoprotein CzcO